MYIIECVSKLGAVRYVRNKPLGSTKMQYSPKRDDALSFDELSQAQPYRDDALEDNRECFIIGTP
jgi:hypothetical protein